MTEGVISIPAASAGEDVDGRNENTQGVPEAPKAE